MTCAVESARAGRLASVVLILGLLLSGTGCALWTPAKSSAIHHPWLQLELRIPEGWMVATFSEGLFTTYHGLELESIHVRRWDRKVEVKGTGRNLEGDLLPFEIAEISLDSRRLDEGVGGLEVLSNAPYVVDGRECYEIDYRFRGETGLRIRTVEVGCAVDEWMYRFEYRAAEQHYFDARRAEFQALVESARFKL
jgi:hypothetical protein